MTTRPEDVLLFKGLESGLWALRKLTTFAPPPLAERCACAANNMQEIIKELTEAAATRRIP